MGKKETATYLISVSSTSGPKGAVLLDFEDTPELMAIRVDPKGDDLKLGKGRFYTAEEMKRLGYETF